MSSIDDTGKNIAVYKADKNGLSVITNGAEIAEFVGAVGSVAGFVILAYEFLKNYFDPPKDAVYNKLLDIEKMVNSDKLSEVINGLLPLASIIDHAGTTILTQYKTPSDPNRASAKTEFEKLSDVLGDLLAGRSYRLIPAAYTQNGKVPGWVYGEYEPGYFYAAENAWNVSPEWFQLYVQRDKHTQQEIPLAYQTAVPDSLPKTENRWDGSLCLTLVQYALPVWQMALALLEPFYRLSGQWLVDIQTVSKKMKDDFGGNWFQSVVWTREMPTPSEIALSGAGYFLPGLPPPFDAGQESSATGFVLWSWGVVDPIIGVGKICRNWWRSAEWGSNTGPAPEWMTDEQRAQFKAIRLSERLKLDDANGYNTFMQTAQNVANLQKPPWVSPSMAIHPQLINSKRRGLQSPTNQTVTDPGGTDWTGSVIRSAVTVTAPVSVQPNPRPAGLPQRAESDVVFGYEITVTPAGGAKQHAADWVWPLRHQAGESSLYHDPSLDGTEIRKVPYSTTHEFSDQAQTWETVTDGKHRGKTAESKGPVKFRMTVQVNDQKDPRIPMDQSDPKQKLWYEQHGAIWITVQADEEENLGRSFEIRVDVKETARVDKNGRLQSEPDFDKVSGFKTYTSQMTLPIDVCLIKVPQDYFAWIKKRLDDLRHIKESGKPGPQPGPDPVRELSEWHAFLEKDASALNIYVRELRQITRKPSLTPRQVLAQLGAAVAMLARPEIPKSPGET